MIKNRNDYMLTNKIVVNKFTNIITNDICNDLGLNNKFIPVNFCVSSGTSVSLHTSSIPFNSVFIDGFDMLFDRQLFK